MYKEKKETIAYTHTAYYDSNTPTMRYYLILALVLSLPVLANSKKSKAVDRDIAKNEPALKTIKKNDKVNLIPEAEEILDVKKRVEKDGKVGKSNPDLQNHELPSEPLGPKNEEIQDIEKEQVSPENSDNLEEGAKSKTKKKSRKVIKKSGTKEFSDEKGTEESIPDKDKNAKKNKENSERKVKKPAKDNAKSKKAIEANNKKNKTEPKKKNKPNNNSKDANRKIRGQKKGDIGVNEKKTSGNRKKNKPKKKQAKK